jgi:hypothetical protein
MTASKLFEQIYSENNPEEETEHNFLDFPLDTDSKPPMWLNEALFERILREAEIPLEMVEIEKDKLLSVS